MTTQTRDLVVTDLTVRYGAFTAVDAVSATFPSGQITGLVGPNGAGKSTLLNAASGFAPKAAGRVAIGERDVTDLDTKALARLGLVRGFQTVRLMERETLLTNVLLGTERLPHAPLLSQLLPLPAHRRDRLRDVSAAMEVLELLDLADNADRRVDELPFAERRLVEVARVLVSRPEVILLDEPAAGLDARGRDDLARVLTEVHRHSDSTMVVVEHDVDLVKRLCSHVVVLASGAHLTSGTPEQVFADAAVRLAYFGSETDA